MKENNYKKKKFSIYYNNNDGHLNSIKVIEFCFKHKNPRIE